MKPKKSYTKKKEPTTQQQQISKLDECAANGVSAVA